MYYEDQDSSIHRIIFLDEYSVGSYSEFWVGYSYVGCGSMRIGENVDGFS